MLSELDKINHLKAILVDYATEHDNKNGGYVAIQCVQKMAGYSSFKDYLHAICDGIWYGNWPWNRYGGTLEQAIKSGIPTCKHVFRDKECVKCGGKEYTGQVGV